MSATVVATTTQIGNVPDSPGSCSQSHLIYAVNQSRWWLFYLTGPDVTQNAISCRVSSSNDLITATWSDPTNPTSPTDGGAGAFNKPGRNIGVAYANISSTDVVHIRSFNTSSDFYDHIRATITGATTITWGAWVTGVGAGTSVMNAIPVGPALGIFSNAGTYYVYATEENNAWGNAYRSTNADSGSAWTSGWNSEVAWDDTAPAGDNLTQTNVFGLADLGGGTALAFAEKAGLDPNSTGVNWAKSDSSGVWTASSKAAIFTDTSTQDRNDWGSVGRTTSDVHAVKRKTATTFEHRRFNGTSWSAGDTLPATSLTGHLAGSGIFMATDGTSVWAFLIDTNANKDVKYVKWVSGTGWDSAWSTLSTNTNTKGYISGYQQAANNQINVIWSENASTPWQVDVASLSLLAVGNPYIPQPDPIFVQRRL